MKKILLFLSSLLILFAVTSCSDTGLNEEEPESQELSGDSLTFSRVEFDEPHARPKASSDGDGYYCTISTLAHKNVGYNYVYDSFYIDIPPSLTQEAPIVFERTITSEKAENIDYAGTRRGKDNVIRVARCMIPDNEQVYDLVQEFLSKYGKHSWLKDDISNKSAKVRKSNSGEWNYVCTKEDSYVIYVIDTVTDEEYWATTFGCVEGYWTYTDDGDVGGGDGDPSGGDQSFPQDCENDVTTPCPPSGGGPPPGCPGEMVENEDGVCVIDEADPCDTGDPIIDDLDIQNAFIDLYEDSRFDQLITQRVEQGGWITENTSTGDLEFEDFPSSWTRYACGIAMPQNWVNSAPSNTVAMIHTHPFFEGENTTDSNVCGQEYGTEEWESGFGNDDLQALIDLANHLNNYNIKGYVIDGNNIITYNPLSFTGPEDIDQRCGY